MAIAFQVVWIYDARVPQRQNTFSNLVTKSKAVSSKLSLEADIDLTTLLSTLLSESTPPTSLGIHPGPAGKTVCGRTGRDGNLVRRHARVPAGLFVRASGLDLATGSPRLGPLHHHDVVVRPADAQLSVDGAVIVGPLSDPVLVDPDNLLLFGRSEAEEGDKVESPADGRGEDERVGGTGDRVGDLVSQLDPVLVEPSAGDGVAAVQAGLEVDVNNVGR
jgi:hypothetical protein